MYWESVSSYVFCTGELEIQIETRIQYSGFFFKSEVADVMARIYLDLSSAILLNYIKGISFPLSK